MVKGNSFLLVFEDKAQVKKSLSVIFDYIVYTQCFKPIILTVMANIYFFLSVGQAFPKHFCVLVCFYRLI